MRLFSGQWWRSSACVAAALAAVVLIHQVAGPGRHQAVDDASGAAAVVPIADRPGEVTGAVGAAPDPGADRPASDDNPTAAADQFAWHDVVVAKTLLPGMSADQATSTDDDIRDAMATVDASYAYATDGAIRFRLSHITTWLTTPVTCSEPDKLWTDIAQRAGWQRGPRQHLVLYIPAVADCKSWGEAELNDHPDAGGMLYVSDPKFPAATTAHELGHNLGLMHSQTFSGCPVGIADGTGPRGSRTGGCQVDEYGDAYDIMGDPTADTVALQAMNLSPINTEYLGLRRNDFYKVTKPMVITVGNAALPHQPEAPRYPIVVGPSGTEYYLEYRSSTGNTSWLADEKLGAGGVLVRTKDTHPAAQHAGATRGILLDAPRAFGKRSSTNRFLTTNHGQLHTAHRDLTFQVLSTTDTTATVVVRMAGQSPPVPKTRQNTELPLAAPAPGGSNKARVRHDLPDAPPATGGQQKTATTK